MAHWRSMLSTDLVQSVLECDPTSMVIVDGTGADPAVGDRVVEDGRIVEVGTGLDQSPGQISRLVGSDSPGYGEKYPPAAQHLFLDGLYRDLALGDLFHGDRQRFPGE